MGFEAGCDGVVLPDYVGGMRVWGGDGRCAGFGGGGGGVVAAAACRALTRLIVLAKGRGVRLLWWGCRLGGYGGDPEVVRITGSLGGEFLDERGLSGLEGGGDV